jgi:hypothetical protein
MIAEGYDKTATGTFLPIVHSNKYNFIFISETLFSFCRYNSNIQFIVQNQDNTILSATDLAEAKNDFKTAMRVSFNVEKQFLLSPSNIIIYELQYSKDGTSLAQINKLAVMSLSSDVSA